MCGDVESNPGPGSKDKASDITGSLDNWFTSAATNNGPPAQPEPNVNVPQSMNRAMTDNINSDPILQAIASMRDEMNTRFNRLEVSIGQLESENRHLHTEVEDLKSRISNLENEIRKKISYSTELTGT